MEFLAGLAVGLAVGVTSGFLWGKKVYDAGEEAYMTARGYIKSVGGWIKAEAGKL